MQQMFIQKLHKYLFDNNLDLLVTLQCENKVSDYLQDKVSKVMPLMEELLADDTPVYIIAERCIDQLAKNLRHLSLIISLPFYQKILKLNITSLEKVGYYLRSRQSDECV